MKIENFLTASGAVAIGLIAITLVTFPLLAIFIAFGYLYIQESLDKDEDD